MTNLNEYLNGVRLEIFTIRESANFVDDFEMSKTEAVYINSDDDATSIDLVNPASKELAELTVWGKK